MTSVSQGIRIISTSWNSRVIKEVRGKLREKSCQSLNSVGLMPNCFLKQAEK